MENSIEEDIKKLEKLSKCYIYCMMSEDTRALKRVLKEYKRQKQINEEHRKENGLLREKVKELEEENLHWRGQYHLITRKIDIIPKQKIKDKIEELTNTKGDFATYIAISERIQVLQELLQKEDK